MPISPSTDNYTLGKGRLFFNPLVNNVYTGELALGNAPALTFSLAIEKLDHYSSQSGLRAKDKTVITQVTPTVTFTLDEVNSGNLNMLVMGTRTNSSQTAGDALAQTLVATAPVEGVYYETGKRSIGIYKLVYSNIATGPFDDGETITGGTSSATAVVRRDKTAANTLYLTTIGGTAPFSVGETITGGTSAANAKVVTIPYFDNKDAVVTDTAGTLHYDVGDDFIVNTGAGLIGIAEGSDISAAGPKYTVAYPTVAYTTINGLANTSLEGMVRFVSDNPEGNQLELRAWKVSLQPDGDTAFIGDDWATIGFTGEILKDETGHPTAPYMEILIS
jgi:hypothetical protein